MACMGCCGRKGWAGAVFGRFLFDHGSKVCVIDVSHSRILWRLLPCADLRHDSAVGTCSNAGSCSRHLSLFAEHYRHGVWSQGVGILSDYLSADYGKESLRYSLMVFSLINVWCAFHYFLGARTLIEDSARNAKLGSAQLATG